LVPTCLDPDRMRAFRGSLPRHPDQGGGNRIEVPVSGPMPIEARNIGGGRMAEGRLRRNWRGISLVVLGIFLGATLFSPAVAHVTDSLTHLFSHTDQRYYKKATANARFLPGAIVPAGRTIRGTFTQLSGPGGYHLANYEFGGRMAGDITPHFIHVGEIPPAQCPGTAANPFSTSSCIPAWTRRTERDSASPCTRRTAEAPSRPPAGGR
jgi:hypothetical protein